MDSGTGSAWAAKVVSAFGAALAFAAVAAAQPCQVTVPPGAVYEEEGCAGGLEGCNGEGWQAVQCGVPLAGYMHFDSTGRDSDWMRLELAQPTTLTIRLASEVDCLFGVLETTTPNPTGACTEFTGFVNPAAFPEPDCVELSVSAELGAGVWTIFVGPQFTTITTGCTDGDPQYLLTIECGAAATDCNGNGIDDGQEIVDDPSLDCFNPLVLSTPNTTGGADGLLDACQCQANWDRAASVNSADISSFLGSWLDAVGGGEASADLNCDSVSNSADISAYLAVWLSAVQDAAPHDGCP